MACTECGSWGCTCVWVPTGKEWNPSYPPDTYPNDYDYPRQGTKPCPGKRPDLPCGSTIGIDEHLCINCQY
jgi:hypothetical protein